MSLQRCRFHIVTQELSDKLQNIVQFGVSIDAQKAYLIIGRLLEVKGTQLKHSIKQQLKVKRAKHAKQTNIWADHQGNIYLVNAC